MFVSFKIGLQAKILLNQSDTTFIVIFMQFQMNRIEKGRPNVQMTSNVGTGLNALVLSLLRIA